MSPIRPHHRLRRLVWLVFGVVLAAFAIFEVIVHDLGPVPIVLFGLLPDLTFIFGIGQVHERGQLPPRAVRPYNLAHRLVIPVALIGLALLGLLTARLLNDEPAAFEAARRLPLLVYVAGISWLAHLALDRAFGFGLRTPDGWQRE